MDKFQIIQVVAAPDSNSTKSEDVYAQSVYNYVYKCITLVENLFIYSQFVIFFVNNVDVYGFKL
ncbi:hypothetical protein KH172YL63_37800 [Bacillus sp. KH172YL63]|nr:hypothetical protein KH172YL63_37800 [Bacillus sp. KH172YL63]